jgi:hypothetical protein
MHFRYCDSAKSFHVWSLPRLSQQWLRRKRQVRLHKAWKIRIPQRIEVDVLAAVNIGKAVFGGSKSCYFITKTTKLSPDNT